MRELLVEHCDLILGGPDLGFRLGDGGAGLIFAFAYLLIIEYGDGFPCFDRIAFAETDLFDAAAGFGGDSGIVSFDAAAEGDNAIGQGRVGEKDFPNAETDQKQKDGNQYPREERLFGGAASFSGV